jgi:hypothetical protein
MANRVPVILKHTSLKIYEKGGIDGSTNRARFQSAWNIARARLTEYGFLTPGSQEGPASRIRLTARGRARTLEHARESSNAQKNKKFDELYEEIKYDRIKKDQGPAT